jgi:OOP family OmpA-OmpF porin
MMAAAIRVLLAACAVAPAVALAQAPVAGAYVGGGVGRSDWRIDYGTQVGRAYEGTGFTVDVAQMTDRRDTAWKLFGGWRFHTYGALEAGYVDFGEATAHYEIGVPNIGAATRDARYRVAGVEVAALGVVPVGDRATVFAKAGAMFTRMKYDEHGANQFGEAASFSHTDRQTRFTWGLGGTYALADALSLRVEWQRVEDVGEPFALTENGNGRFEHLDWAGVALQWRFR